MKLEGLMQNSLYVNLLCTGLIARLAAYPQPLLRSLLLNHTLVFQPTVKSLIQVGECMATVTFPWRGNIVIVMQLWVVLFMAKVENKEET